MRSDEIRKEALSVYSHANVRDRYDADLMMAGFSDGAEWADAHPVAPEPQGEPSFEVPEPSTDARCCAHVKCPSGSLCCCIDEAPGASACVCLPAIAGISDGPNVDCPEHGERLDVAVLREAWVHYTAVGASVEVQEQKAAVFDRWIAGPRVEPSCDYEAGYAEGFHHGVSTPRGSAENDREQGEPSDAQVEAALIAHLGYDPAPAGFPFKDDEKDQMRAALRAAEEAKR